jgi:hypothetical protein
MGDLRGFRKTADNAGQPAWRAVHRSQNRLVQVRPAITVSAVEDEQAHTGDLGEPAAMTAPANQACRPGSGDIQKPAFSAGDTTRSQSERRARHPHFREAIGRGVAIRGQIPAEFERPHGLL